MIHLENNEIDCKRVERKDQIAIKIYKIHLALDVSNLIMRNFLNNIAACVEMRNAANDR